MACFAGYQLVEGNCYPDIKYCDTYGKNGLCSTCESGYLMLGGYCYI